VRARKRDCALFAGCDFQLFYDFDAKRFDEWDGH